MTSLIEEPKVIAIYYTNLCEQSDPCQHRNVCLKWSDGPVEQWDTQDGVVIAGLYVQHNLEVPEHFKEYVSPQKPY